MRRARLGGFTMMEIAIGMALGVIVIGAVVMSLVMVLQENRRARAHAELQRDAAHVTQLLTQEIRMAGSGVPTGSHVNPSYDGGAVSRFDARRVLVADAEDIVIVGDLPRPDANYPAFGVLHDRANNSLNAISWHTENNGTCVPKAADCNIGSSSVFFPLAGGLCNSSTARWCPWYGRLESGDRIQVVDGAGLWSHAGMASLSPVTPVGLVSADLSPAMAGYGGWTNDVDGSYPTGKYGQGWVTSIDRVAYRFDAGTNTIRRQQCWGDPSPSNANWPGPTVATLPGSLSVSPAGTASICPAEEIIARHVQSVAYRYLDATGGTNFVGAATANAKNLIRRIEWTIVFSVVDATLVRPVTYTAIGSVGLQNINLGEP